MAQCFLRGFGVLYKHENDQGARHPEAANPGAPVLHTLLVDREAGSGLLAGKSDRQDGRGVPTIATPIGGNPLSHGTPGNGAPEVTAGRVIKVEREVWTDNGLTKVWEEFHFVPTMHCQTCGTTDLDALGVYEDGYEGYTACCNEPVMYECAPDRCNHN